MTTPTPSELAGGLSNLRICLQNLEASGDTGFEGLLRDLLEHLMQMTFRLSKSGHQHGIDLRSQATNSLQVGLEAKRYGETSNLPLDALRAKVFDAAAQPEPVDLWILASSRDISIDNQKALEKAGEMHGIAVVVVDWTNSSGALPQMAVLCATAPDICANFLGNPTGLADDLKRIALDPSFASKQARLKEQFAAADIGFAAAAKSLKLWMRDAQSSDVKARARLQGPHNLAEANVVLVRRPALFTALDDWWMSGDVAPVVLVGDEGNGKTWTALSWSQGLNETAALTLYIPARSVATTGLLPTIAAELAKRTKVRDAVFWERRFSVWARDGRVVPPILVILDGIDQHWSVDWVDMIQPLLDPDYAGLFRFVMTCRPDPWTQMGQLSAMAPPPKRIDVPQLSEAELNDLLAQAKVGRDEFVADVLKLMRTPRLSLLAIRRRKELAASGDITAERLIYEDWKDRLLSRRGQHVTDQEFQTFIQGIGQDLRGSGTDFNVTRDVLIDRLSGHSGKSKDDLRASLSEVVNGRWLTADASDANKFVLQKDLAPFALGLALAGDLGGALSVQDADGRIAGYLDELKGQSLGVQVLRAAVTVALLDTRVERTARRALLERWISEQNFNRDDFNALWRMVGVDIDLFCDLIEQNWLHPGGGLFFDEILIKGAANAYEFPDVAPVLRDRIIRWLGWAWPDPISGFVLGEWDLSSMESQKNQARTLGNFDVWTKASNATARWPVITMQTSGNVSWFNHRVIGIMSFLPREPFVEALLAWAISRSIMTMPRHFEELAWLLRLNKKDPDIARTAVVAAAIRLRDEGSVIARRGAGWLLEALGDPQADQLAADIRACLKQDFGGDFDAAQPRHRFEPDGALVPDRILAWTQNPKRAPDGAQFFLYPREQGDHDVNLALVQRKIAHTNPDRLRQLFADAASSAVGRNDSALEGLARRVPRFAYLLTATERDGLRQILETRAQGITDPEQATALRSAARVLALWGLPAAEQVAIIMANQPVTFDGIPPNILALLTPPDWPALQVVIDATTDVSALRGWMHYLDYAATPAMLRDWLGLATLVVHVDAVVQQKALELAWSARNPQALEAFANSGWSATGETNKQLVALGSGMLMAARLDLSMPIAPGRMHPEMAAEALGERPTDPQLLDSFEAFFKAQMEWSVSPGSRSLPQYWRGHTRAIRALLQARKDSLLPWITAWLDAHPKLSHAMLWDDFPVISLCRVLLEIDPALGIRLWNMLLRMMAEDIVNRDDLYRVVLEVGNAPEVQSACRTVLAGFDKDQQIFEFAIAAMKHGRVEWLRAEIEHLIKEANPASQALGYLLAGYLDRDTDSDALWQRVPAPAAHARWLSDVYEMAKLSYDENGFAHAWHQRFLQATDPADAFAALELFFECADARAQIWAVAEIRASRDEIGAEKRSHWWMNSPRLNDAAKKSRDAKKDKLFGTRIMDQTQDPWL
jgi:hypothetical protein